MAKKTMGLIVGTRGFFPAGLANEGRKEFISLLKKKKIDAVVLDPSQTTNGAVETLDDAKKCASLFKSRADDIDGVVVTLPNFGDEKAIANTLRMADLNVPVLVQAYPDELEKMAMGQRRDSFCGKISVCNNLKQYGIPFSLTTLHTISPSDPLFLEDLDRFLATCGVVKGLRRARFGAIGARTGPFNTVRYSERILELSGITIETLDLAEILGAIEKMSDSDPDVKKRLRAIKRYVSTEGVPKEPLVKMAKLALAIDRWMTENELAGTTLQCWTAIEDLLGLYEFARHPQGDDRRRKLIWRLRRSHRPRAFHQASSPRNLWNRSAASASLTFRTSSSCWNTSVAPASSTTSPSTRRKSRARLRTPLKRISAGTSITTRHSPGTVR